METPVKIDIKIRLRGKDGEPIQITDTHGKRIRVVGRAEKGPLADRN